MNAAMTRNINEKERILREQVAHHSHRADVAEEIADRLAARLDKVAEVLAEHWDWKAGRSLHAAVQAAVRWSPDCDHDWQAYWDGSLGYPATEGCEKCGTYRPIASIGPERGAE